MQLSNSETELLGRETVLLHESSDFSDSTVAATGLVIGTRVYGSVEQLGDVDTFSVNLLAGQQLMIAVNGANGSSKALIDPMITIVNSIGQILSLADDIRFPADRNSLMRFTAQQDGEYFIQVSGKPPEDDQYVEFASIGNFVLEVSDRFGSIDVLASQLTQFAFFNARNPVFWNISLGGHISFTLDGVAETVADIVRQAIDIWSATTGLTFLETSNPKADITFTDDGNGMVARPSYNFETGELNIVSVNIGQDWIANYGLGLSSQTFTGIVHEIGHALGLGHPGRYNLYGFTYETDSILEIDTTQYSIMSYFQNQEQANMPFTLMMGDIAAMEALYGPLDFVLGQGDSIWGMGNNLNGYFGDVMRSVFDGLDVDGFDRNSARAITIRDSGGIDTINFAGSSTNNHIDLNDMASSSVLGRIDNLMIARDTMIENAVSGRGNDVLIGNELNNRLIGRLGSDRLNGSKGADYMSGGAGHDTLNGGLGNDRMLGGAGNDVYFVNVTGDRVFETTTTVSATDAGGTDTVRSAVSFNLDANAGARFVERLTLTGTDNTTGTGNALANVLVGNSGNNVLSGGLGNDTLLGGAGNDTFVFNTAPSDTNVDRITDFNVAEDTVRLDDMVFAGLVVGTLVATAFAANLTGAATHALDRIIYETDTGRVFFDLDGNGIGSRGHFATLTANLDLTNADFFVF